MEISVAEQLFALLYSVAVGALLGLMWDLVRLGRSFLGLRNSSGILSLEGKRLPLIGEMGRKTVRRSGALADVFVFVVDLIYFVVASIVFCVFVFHANYGNGRWFLVAGCAVGFILWFFTLGRVVMALSDLFGFIIACLGAYIRFFLTLPIRLINKYVVVPVFRAIAFRASVFYTEKQEKHLGKALFFKVPDDSEERT